MPPRAAWGRGQPRPAPLGRGYTQGRGAPWRPPMCGPPTGMPRPSFYCYSYGKPRHIARDYRQQPLTTNNVSAYAAETFNAFGYNQFDPYYYNSPDMYSQADTNPWYIDSGATSHIAADTRKLDSVPVSSRYHSIVRTGGGESHPVNGSGTSTIQTSTCEIKIKNVRYVQTMKKNLVSVGL